MKTDFIHLTRALKTVLIVLLLSVAGTTKGNAEETDPYLLYMLFNDYQVCEQLVPQRERNGIDDIRCMQLPRDESGMQASWYYLNTAARTTGFLAMAKNEKEGFQVFFREQEKERLDEKITQAEEKERRYTMQQKILLHEQSQLDRKKRNHRIFTRGAMLESFLKKPLLMTDEQVFELLKTAFNQSEIQTRETELLKETIVSMNREETESEAFPD